MKKIDPLELDEAIRKGQHMLKEALWRVEEIRILLFGLEAAKLHYFIETGEGDPNPFKVN